MSMMWLLEKKFLLVFNIVVSCLSCKSKISLFLVELFMKSFRLVGAFNNVLSKPVMLKLIDKVYSYVVLFLSNGRCSDSVRLGNMSR